MDKNSRPLHPLQFTKLTSDDIAKHNDSYKCLLMWDSRPLGEKGKELHQTAQRFYQTFK